MRLASSDLALLIDSRMLRARSGGANSYAVAIYLAISDDTCDKSHMAALAQRFARRGAPADDTDVVVVVVVVVVLLLLRCTAG